MGLLDQITGALGQQTGAAQGPSSAMQMVLAMINQHPGGLQGLIQSLMSGGLGQQVQSWISTGNNLPISAEQLQSILGSGQLAQLAKQFGVSESQAAQSVSQALPQVVDHITPNGVVQEDALQEGLNLLKSKLFG
jgi:uncharacterized protein YidB (DUF937 family)